MKVRRCDGGYELDHVNRFVVAIRQLEAQRDRKLCGWLQGLEKSSSRRINRLDAPVRSQVKNGYVQRDSFQFRVVIAEAEEYPFTNSD